jgi:hypothetical protein
MLAKRTNRNTCGKQSGPDFFLTYTLCLEPLLFTLAGVRAVLFPDLARGHRTGRSTCCVISRPGPWAPNWQEYVLCHFQTWPVGTELAGVRAVLFPELARGHRTGRSTCCVISRTGPWAPNWQEYVLCYFQTWSVGTELAGVRAETLGAVCGADRPGH